jgi:recombination protein RecR
VDRLISALASLPGVGRRSAERMAFHLLKSDEESALGLAQAIVDLKKRVGHCPICFNLTDTQDGAARECSLCADARRDRSLVLVVEQPKDLIALELTGMYRGLYHVLMGRLSPMDEVSPAELTISQLLTRLTDGTHNAGGVAVREVILGLNPTVEGDGTAMYLAEQIAHLGLRVTRLARGLPTGSQLEFANKSVLADAIEGRQTME